MKRERERESVQHESNPVVIRGCVTQLEQNRTSHRASNLIHYGRWMDGWNHRSKSSLFSALADLETEKLRLQRRSMKPKKKAKDPKLSSSSLLLNSFITQNLALNADGKPRKKKEKLFWIR